MPDRREQILRATSLGLVVVLAFQLVGLVIRRDPSAGLTVPATPHWQASEEASSSSPTNRAVPAGAAVVPQADTNPPLTYEAAIKVLNMRTNPVAVAGPASGGNLVPGLPPAGAPPMRRGGPAGPARPLPPVSQARVDRITQSEMLAPVFHPPPMALLGIAGLDAFIRTPSGQTTLLREGGESDGIKLLRLGTNRVLIEQAGEKKELTIFSGLGSESFLPK